MAASALTEGRSCGLQRGYPLIGFGTQHQGPRRAIDGVKGFQYDCSKHHTPLRSKRFPSGYLKSLCLPAHTEQ